MSRISKHLLRGFKPPTHLLDKEASKIRNHKSILGVHRQSELKLRGQNGSKVSVSTNNLMQLDTLRHAMRPRTYLSRLGR